MQTWKHIAFWGTTFCRGLPHHFRGRGTGIWQGAFSFGQFLMPILVVAISGVAGGLGGTLRWFAAAALLIAFFAIIPGRRSNPATRLERAS